VRKLALVTVALTLLVAACSSAPAKTKPRSDRLPDVTLVSLTGGSPVDLGKLRGPTVVNLWAQWCGPCKRELPIYQEFYARHAATVSVLGVDWQDTQPERARRLASRSGVAYPLVVDREPEIRNKFLPSLILVGADGKIAFQEYVEITSLSQLEQLVEKHLGVTL
jgi:cytochrome c biogenesis protein CcmG, thiol:disulfide interchange protein DsbE